MDFLSSNGFGAPCRLLFLRESDITAVLNKVAMDIRNKVEKYNYSFVLIGYFVRNTYNNNKKLLEV